HAMARLRQGRTGFVIAHRLSTIRNADSIVVMDQGRIVEQGSHAELLRRGGFYSTLYNSQFSDVLEEQASWARQDHAVGEWSRRAYGPGGDADGSHDAEASPLVRRAGWIDRHRRPLCMAAAGSVGG